MSKKVKATTEKANPPSGAPAAKDEPVLKAAAPESHKELVAELEASGLFADAPADAPGASKTPVPTAEAAEAEEPVAETTGTEIGPGPGKQAGDETEEEEPEGVPAPDGIETKEAPAEEPEDTLAALAELTDEELAAKASDEKWESSYLKRVKKFTRQFRATQAQLEGVQELREERDALKAKLEERQAAVPPEQEAAGPQTLSAAEKELAARLETLEDWLVQLEGGGQDGMTLINDQCVEVTYPPEAVRKAKVKYYAEAASTRTRLDLYRAQQQQMTAEYSAEARKQHAFLRDKTSVEYARIQKVLRLFPSIQQIPDHLSVLTDAMAWRKMQAAGKVKNGDQTETPPSVRKAPLPTARPPGRGAAPQRLNQTAVNVAAAIDKFAKSGSIEDGKALIEHGLLAGVET